MGRADRVAEAVRQETSIIIHDKLRDPRLGFVTITQVEVTPDLRYAKIFFSVLGNDDAYKRTKEALDSALGFIRRLVAERLNLRFAPELAFFEDRSGEYSVRIQQVLDEIKEKNESEKPARKVRKEKKSEPTKSRRRNKKT